MKNNSKYDERQLAERGRIYQQAFILVLCLLGIDTLLQEMGIVWADDFSRRSFVFVISLIFCLIRMIWTDSSGYGDCSKINYNIILTAILPLFILFTTISDMLREHIQFISNGQLSSKGAYLIDGFLFLSISITHLIKLIRNKKADADKEE
jgi:hypothetical protein